MIVIGTSLTPELLQSLLKNFGTPFTNVFVTLPYPHFTVTDRPWALSLSTTLASRAMLHLHSYETRHHCDSSVMEQTTDVRFVPTLSELSGGPPSVPTALTGYGNDEVLELKRL